MSSENRSDTYRLSPIQEGMLFHHLNAKHSGIDIEQIVCTIREPLDLIPLQSAWRRVVERHDVLRTSFHWQRAEDPYQRVHKAVQLPFAVRDLRGLSAEQQEIELQGWLREDRKIGFDLDQAPLFRLNLFRLADDSSTLVWTFHHIILDGRSFPTVLSEVFRTYDAKCRGEEIDLPPVRPYRDYIEWLHSRDLTAAEEFWRNTLRDFASTTRLAVLEEQGGEDGYGEEEIQLSASASKALHDLAGREGFTLNNAVQAAWALVLSRYNGTSDVVFGATRACRGSFPGARSMAGTFINTLPVRITVGGDKSIFEWLRQIRATQIAVRDFEHTPLTRISSWSDLPAGSPLFESILVFDHAPLDSEMKSQGIHWANRKVHLLERTNFPLTLYAYAEPALTLRLAYDARRFGRAKILRALGHLRTILEQIASQTAERVGNLQMLTEEERRQSLQVWNDTDTAYPRDQLIHELIEEQARRTPNEIAVVFRDDKITYAELEQRANQLAGYLICLGVQPTDRVGVSMPRSIDMVVALLAVLKAGGAYLPLDPTYPQDRLRFIVKDAEATVILTEERLRSQISAKGVRAVAPDSAWEAIAKSETARVPALDSNSPAYVMYTSGSTGKPKGVSISHRNVMNFFAGMDQKLATREPGVWLALTSISFDISVLELFWTLSRGFRVILQEENHLLPDSSVPLCQAPTRGIEFSLFYFASDESESGSDYQLLMEGAKFADQNRFTAVWTPERHFHRFGGPFPNPSVISAALAMITRNLQIRAGSVVLPLHDPIRVAEDWAVVDRLSKGRVGVSFASGWHDRDFVLAPDDYADRKKIMARDLEQVRALWRGEKITRRSGSGQQVEVSIYPRPVQPELPVWITAGGDPNTFRAAGEAGANLLTHLLGQSIEELQNKIAIYRKAMRDKNGTDGHVTLMLHTFVSNSTEEVERTIRKPLCDYLKSSVDLMKQVVRGLGEELSSTELSQEDLAALVDHGFERYYTASGLFGTPETCLATVRKLQAAGVDEIACLIDFGIEPRTVLANLHNLRDLLDLANQPVALGHSIPEQIVAHCVTHMQSTPSLARMLVNHPVGRQAVGSLKTLLVGGEALPMELARDLLETGVGELWNMYGPTETTIWSSMDKVETREGAVSIGRPIANTKLFILDDNRQLTPAGVAGELYIGGEGVARGYLNRPELTAERFVEIRFDGASERVYRTGDLVRRLPDGRIEFLGRIDNQVKIRGHRIELGEIEAVLCSHPLVRETIVSAATDSSGDQALAAYIIPRNGKIPSASDLRSFLAERLPSAMVPSAFVPLKSFPLTPNGKVDRKHLPKPELATAERIDGPAGLPQPPVDEIETRLIDIWCSLLELPSAGVDDDFFEAGGHSLKAVRLFSAIKNEFDVDLPLATLFQAPTVRGIARILRNSGVESARSAIVPIQRKGTKAPILCIGALNGEVILFRRLAAALSAARPMYGLQPFGLMNDRAALLDVKQIAAYYLKQLRAAEQQPSCLLGYSFGGLVALEMAQQLHAGGNEAPPVVLIDTYYPKGCKAGENLQDRVRRCQFHFSQVLRGRGFAYLAERLTRHGRSFLYRTMSAAGPASSSHLVNEIVTLQEFASDHYLAKPHSGRVCIFRATTRHAFLHGGPLLGWDGIFQKNPVIYDIPGDHGTINVGENVALMARNLEEFLEAAARPRTVGELVAIAS